MFENEPPNIVVGILNFVLIGLTCNTR